MYSVTDDAALPASGFPIRRSAGQKLFSASPRLIAAVHVLLRLLVPRHPPCALTILTVSSGSPEGEPENHACPRASVGEYPFTFGHWCSFQAPPRSATGVARRRSLKTEQR